ncbi:transcriptional regulator [Luteimonas fraxinea]|uniref:Helix-turn-helix domain-containing protein n=1 Tax=Luteimonas fraxinea TaxID=2901869 RepID=A0ABS8U9L4_9GAMM|nr:YdaS family helix-turn-helix protein [Luteimonas fraxinea]MCD9096162.1 helix-turn-helix domain-containing protein [Luteimonas fraxinea]
MDLITYRSQQGVSQAAFAAQLTKAGSPATQGLISQWEKGDVKVPAERIAKIVEVTGGLVTGSDLRPDVFGPPPAADQQKAA